MAHVHYQLQIAELFVMRGGGKCSVNIYSVLVLVSYGDDVLPRQTVRRILNSIYWGEGFFDQQSSFSKWCLSSCESHPKASVVCSLSGSGLLGKAYKAGKKPALCWSLTMSGRLP